MNTEIDRVHHEVGFHLEQAVPAGHALWVSESFREVYHDPLELIDVEGCFGRNRDPDRSFLQQPGVDLRCL